MKVDRLLQILDPFTISKYSFDKDVEFDAVVFFSEDNVSKLGYYHKTVFICDNIFLNNDLICENGNLLILFERSISSFEIGNNSILLKQGEPQSVYHVISEELRYERRLEHSNTILLHTLFKGKGLQELVNVASVLLENPVFICDTSNKILSYSTTHGHIDDVAWNNIQTKGYGSYTRMVEIRKSGDMDLVYSRDEPLIGKYSFAKVRYLAARIRINSHVVGHICSMEYLHSFTKIHNDILVLVCRTVACLLQRDPNFGHDKYAYSSILYDLLQGTLADVFELENRIKTTGIVFSKYFPTYYRVIVVKPKQITIDASLYYIRDQLQASFQIIKGVVYNGYVVLLLPQKQETLPKMPDQMMTMFIENDLICGVSRAFKDLINMRTYFLQAKNALELAKKLDMQSRVNTYEQVAPFHLVKIASQHDDLSQICSDVIRRVMRYDSENNTSFLKDLYVLVMNAYDLGRSAEQQHIHRNSMRYRAKKLEEIMGASLDDADARLRIEISFLIMSVVEGYRMER